MTAINLNLEPLVEELNHEQFYKLCMANKDIAMERSSAGKLIIMSPVGGESGRQEANYIIDLGIWNRQTGLGKSSVPQRFSICPMGVTALRMQPGFN